MGSGDGPANARGVAIAPFSVTDRIVTLVEKLGDYGRVSIQAQRQLRHVFGADGHAVKVFQVTIG